MGLHPLIGSSAAIRCVRERIERVAATAVSVVGNAIFCVSRPMDLRGADLRPTAARTRSACPVRGEAPGHAGDDRRGSDDHQRISSSTLPIAVRSRTAGPTNAWRASVGCAGKQPIEGVSIQSPRETCEGRALCLSAGTGDTKVPGMPGGVECWRVSVTVLQRKVGNAAASQCVRQL
jgi:hypothetical protein